MKRNPYKGVRKVTWRVTVVNANGSEATLVKGLNKQEVKNYLRNFNAKDENIKNGIRLRIYRISLIDSGYRYKTELMGYTDILEHGAVTYIEL